MVEPYAIVGDAGVPMIFVQWPAMLCALVPVIVLEAIVVRRNLSVPYRRAFIGSAKANVISTLAGVPLAWVLMLALEFSTLLPLAMAAEKWHWGHDSLIGGVAYFLGAAWVAPPSRSLWPIPFAAMVLLLPTFFVSVWLERLSYRSSYADLDKNSVDRVSWSANLMSYSLLFVVACAWLGWEIYTNGETAPAMNRMLQEQPIDVAYLRDVVIPSCDAGSRPEFAVAVTKLESVLDDFRKQMRDVEQGRLAVWKHFGNGRWNSQIERPDNWTEITYADRLGPVTSFQTVDNVSNSNRLSFRFNNAGYVERVDFSSGEFSFDDKGRLTHWRGAKAECWGTSGK